MCDGGEWKRLSKREGRGGGRTAIKSEAWETEHSLLLSLEGAEGRAGQRSVVLVMVMVAWTQIRQRAD